MAVTSQTRRWHWIQFGLLMVLGALAAASAAFGQTADPNLSEPAASNAQAQSPAPPQAANQSWPGKPIIEINIDPRDPSDQVPPDKSAELIGAASATHWFNEPHPSQYVYWTAPNIRYQPLYLEDVRLERCGQQPWGHFDVARSAVLFWLDVNLLPISIFYHCPHSCVSPAAGAHDCCAAR